MTDGRASLVGKGLWRKFKPIGGVEITLALRDLPPATKAIWQSYAVDGDGPIRSGGLLCGGARLVRIRTAPHTGRPELARPKSLILAYRERAIGTWVSVVPPIGDSSLGVRLVFYPRRCISLTKRGASNKRSQDGAGQSKGVAHSSLLNR
jgi:hypothetical protein